MKYLYILYCMLQSTLHTCHHCGCFILEKGIIFCRSIKGTSKKLKNIQCFGFVICYCGIFRKSGMSDI